MKILIPAHLFYPSTLGGPSKTLYWLAKGLIRQGAEVFVVTTTNYIPDGCVIKNRWIEVDGIKIIYCESKSKFSFRLILNSIMKLHSVDVVLLSSICYMPLFFIAFLNLFYNKKLFWSPRGELFDSAIQENKYKLTYIKILSLLFKNKAIFHATSNEEKIVIEKYFTSSCKTVVIPNYLELPSVCKREQNNKPYLLYVGRLAQIKALNNLFEALLLSEKFISSEYTLILCGPREGEYYESLLQFVENHSILLNRIEFRGNVDGDEKFDYYANAYFTLLVSNSENFGNVVVESLSQGTPVVASLGTPWESLVIKNSGYWISNDKESIAKCIDDIISLPEGLYNVMRENAKLHSKEFDVYYNINKWIEVFNK